MTVAALVSLIYIKLTKMDIRFRYSFLMMNCFVDIKNVHRLIINSFCYHLKDKSAIEKDFCSSVVKNNFVHMFFQSVITWYVAFNLIRIDRKCDRNVRNIQAEVNGQPVHTHGKIKAEKMDEVKGIYSNYVKAEDKTLKATSSFYDKVMPFYSEDKQVWWREMIYVIMRPPLIAMFTGFIVGFITPLQTWIFNTSSAVYVRKK